jgi:class 3 adenylate cyclase
MTTERAREAPSETRSNAASTNEDWRGIHLTPLVGRRREKDHLVAGLQEALSGRGHLFLLVGESGIGKTRLCEEAATTALSCGMEVAWGASWEAGGAPPYWPWTQAIRCCIRHLGPRRTRDLDEETVAQLARLLPELERFEDVGQEPVLPKIDVSAGEVGDRESERFQFFDGITSFLRNFADKTPLAIILDDFHAADRESILLALFVARQLARTKLVLIAAYRETEARSEAHLREVLGQLSHEGENLLLRGLSAGDVREFVELSTGGTPSDSIAETLRQVTDGNPFFLTEIIRLLVAEGRNPDWETVRPGSLQIPDSVRNAIKRRLSFASDDARDVLCLASLVGREFDRSTLRTSGLEEKRVFAALEEAVKLGLISDIASSPGRYRFGNFLVAQALSGEIPDDRRRILHYQIADCLETAHAADPAEDCSELAHHYFQALPVACDKAVLYARRAADRAMRSFGFDEAISLYRMALSSLQVGGRADNQLKCELLLGLGEAECFGRQFDRFRQTFREAATIAGGIENAALLARAALGYGMLGNYEASDPATVELLKEALAAVGDDDSPMRAALLARLAEEIRWSTPAAQTAEVINEAIRVARAVSDPATLIEALYIKYHSMRGPDLAEERLRLTSEVVEIAERHRLGRWLLRAHYHRGAVCLELGNASEVYREIAAVEQIPESVRLGTQGLSFTEISEIIGAMRSLVEGRIAEAEQLALRALSVGRDRPNTTANQIFVPQLLLARREQGRLKELAAEVAAVEVGPAVGSVALCMLAFCLAESGQISDARAAFHALAADDFSTVKRDFTWLASIACLSEVCVTLGDAARATVLYNLLSPYSSRNASLDLFAYLGPVSHYLGILATLSGRLDDAELRFKAALEAEQRFRALPWMARTSYQYAAMLAGSNRSGGHDKARELLRQAIATAEALKLDDLIQKSNELARQLTHQGALEGVVESGSTPLASATILLRKDGDFWTVGYGATVSRIRDVKGMSFLARLLQQPHQAMHVLDLSRDELTLAQSPEDPSGITHELAVEGLRFSGLGDAGEMLDAQAKASYKHRLDELREELEEATELGHTERVVEIKDEIESLAQELKRAVGLRGRDRRAASASERARINVTRAIRSAIERIAANNAQLGRLLSTSVRTGTFCSYVPHEAKYERATAAAGENVTSGPIEAIAAAAVEDPRALTAHAAPDGTVTILFSDMEGSSPLFDKLGDLRAHEIVSAHNKIVRDQMALHHGFEVKSMGDGFMIAFSSARRALLSAIGIQRAFAEYREQHSDVPIRVRIGLHVGETINVSADFFGKAVIVAARIASLARAGEILVSSTLYDLTSTAGDLRFIDAGEVELKGLSGRYRLYRTIW